MAKAGPGQAAASTPEVNSDLPYVWRGLLEAFPAASKALHQSESWIWRTAGTLPQVL